MSMNPSLPTAFGCLLLTVAFETFGTACLQASQQFTRLWPSLGVALGYALSFWFLAQALRTLPLAIAYATWSGLGVLNIAVVGAVIFGQRIDGPGLVGIALVCSGLVVMHAAGTGRP